MDSQSHDPRHVPAPPPAECGIYGYKTIEEALLDVRGRLEEGRSIYEADGGVLGQVKLWGTIQEHTHGYRAQSAYPASLVMGICARCREVFPVEGMRFLTAKDSLLSARSSVPVFACCAEHRTRGMKELTGLPDSLGNLYRITVGKNTLLL